MRSDLLTMKYATNNTRFVSRLVSELSRVKTARPKMVESAVLYLKLFGNEDNLRFMRMSFFSPKLRLKENADEEYFVEVGDWDEDKNFSQERVRKSLTKLTIPSLKGDVISDDHEILASVLRKLRKVVMDVAVDYFALPLEDKKSFKRVVRLDIQKMEDIKVVIENNGAREVVQEESVEPTKAVAASKSRLITARRGL